MSINKIGSDLIRSLGSQRADRSERVGSEGESADESRGSGRKDRVELSPEGLARAAELAAAESNDGVDPARIAEIHARIDGKFYDDPAVAEAVANRIVASGDLA